MKQQEQETLRANVHQFNKLIELPSATPDLLISAFIQGLKPGDLFNSFVEKLPIIFGDLLEKFENTLILKKRRQNEWNNPRRMAGHVERPD